MKRRGWESKLAEEAAVLGSEEGSPSSTSYIPSETPISSSSSCLSSSSPLAFPPSPSSP